jgi:mannose-6-phosphate isomerase-like protein (cupin superfamily)
MTRHPVDASSVPGFALHAGQGLQEVWLPWHQGNRIAVKASGEATEGRTAIVEFLDQRGSSPPLHAHHDGDEAFYVIEGEVELVCDGRRLEAGDGDFVFIPRGHAHSYLVRSPRARLLAVYTAPGMDRFFVDNGPAIVGDQGPPPATDPDPEALAATAARYALEILGPPLTLEEVVP